MSSSPELSRVITGCMESLGNKVEKDFDLAKPGRNQVLSVIEEVLYECHQSMDPHEEGVAESYRNGYERLKTLRDEIVKQALADYSTNIYADVGQSPCEGACVSPQYREVAGQDPETQRDTHAHIITAGIATMLEADVRIVVYGEDVAKLGGVQHCTVGLQEGLDGVEANTLKRSPALRDYLPQKGFGKARVWDHAMAEDTIIGGAVGMSLRGLRPIAEIQYNDYVVWGLQQMVDEVACLRYRTDGGQACPMLIRTHGHRLMGMWHAGSPMAMVLSSCPGLRVLVPRDGIQAVGMYRAVLESGDPAFSVEPLLMLDAKESVPSNLREIRIPLGQSDVLRKGRDDVRGSRNVTIVTYGYCCTIALDAAIQLAKQGIEAEVIDLQTLNPLDLNNKARDSIKKTENVVFLDEDIPEGATSIISKTLLHERGCWLHVDGVKFVTAPHHKPPYGYDGAFFAKPQARDVVAAVYSMFDEVRNQKVVKALSI